MNEFRKVSDQKAVQISFNAGRIIVEGLREEVDTTKDSIHELLRNFQKKRLLEEYLLLCSGGMGKWDVDLECCDNLIFAHLSRRLN